MSAQASRGQLTSRSSAHEGRHSALVGYAGYKVTGKHSHRTSFIKSHAKIVGSFLYKIPVYVFCTKTQNRSVARLAQLPHSCSVHAATPQLCCTCSYPTAVLYMQLPHSCAVHAAQQANTRCPSTCTLKQLLARLTVDCSAYSRLEGNGLGMHAIYIHPSSVTALIAH